MKRVIKNGVILAIDCLLLPFIIVSAILLKIYRNLRSKYLYLCTQALKRIGIFPIKDHYYEPLFNDAHLTHSLREKRHLPGVNFREQEQIRLLQYLTFQSDFDQFLAHEKAKKKPVGFRIDNGNFGPGDAEFLYNFVRYTKPRKVIEIGCGSSTKIIAGALQANEIDTGRVFKHICIEPFAQSWLNKIPQIELISQKAEEVAESHCSTLDNGDFLFIDSTHIIRPQGDVLALYLRIIPQLKNGVHVHVHDIFTPRDYPDAWLRTDIRFWNEQYLLEGMLSNNASYEIMASLNLLKHDYFPELKKVCPYMTKESEPGSFYFRITEK